VPASWANMITLQEVRVDKTHVSGSLPITKPGTLFSAGETQISGSLPNLCESGARELIMNFVRVSGTLAPCTDRRGGGGYNGLEVLNLYATPVSGSLPKVLFSGGVMKTLVVGFSGLSGSMALGFGNMTSITTVITAGTPMSGTLPITPSISESLMSLIVGFSGNKDKKANKLHGAFTGISGTIPNALFQSGKITSLMLAHCAVSGSVPPGPTWQQLMAGMLSDNFLSGTTPVDVFESTTMHHFIVSRNKKLSGTIPWTSRRTGNKQQDNPQGLFFGHFKTPGLEDIGLGSTVISGTIPTQMVETFGNVNTFAVSTSVSSVSPNKVSKLRSTMKVSAMEVSTVRA
jgi:hypothetical protein